MTSFNQNAGMKPRTRKRAATHARAIASSMRCPECGIRHVVRCQASNSTHEFMCANAHFFDGPQEATDGDAAAR